MDWLWTKRGHSSYNPGNITDFHQIACTELVYKQVLTRPFGHLARSLIGVVFTCRQCPESEPRLLPVRAFLSSVGNEIRSYCFVSSAQLSCMDDRLKNAEQISSVNQLTRCYSYYANSSSKFFRNGVKFDVLCNLQRRPGTNWEQKFTLLLRISTVTLLDLTRTVVKKKFYLYYVHERYNDATSLSHRAGAKDSRSFSRSYTTCVFCCWKLPMTACSPGAASSTTHITRAPRSSST
jgi:hypothetical protein